MRIELLHFEGCPGFTETLDILERVVAEEGVVAEILPAMPGPKAGPGFPGSPTILVDGEDLFPTEQRDLQALSCRIYATPEGPKNHPTTLMVSEALRERLKEGRPAEKESR